MKTEEELELQHNKLIAERLKTVRANYGSKLSEDRNYSQDQIAKICGLTQFTVNRLETDLTGSAKNLFKLLRLYEAAGFNLSWIVSTRNRNISLTKDMIDDDSFMEPLSNTEVIQISHSKFTYSEDTKQKLIRELSKIINREL